MPSQTYKYQQYTCPQEFQDRLTEVGGVNRYDDPNFIIRWAQGGEEECYYRAGGAWAGGGQVTYTGYRDLLVGGGTPSWMLMQWQDATEYGTPEMYYAMNRDESTGLQTLGEYPYKGRYRLLYNLRWMDKKQGRLKFEAMPLNEWLLRTIVPIIKEARDISWEKTKAALKDIEEREKQSDINMIEDVMRNNAVPFHGSPVSYGKQGCHTSLIDKKIENMQRHWNQIMQGVRNVGGPTSRGLIAQT